MGSNFTRPVTMLSLRFLLRKTFCKSFPCWTASEDGLQRLQQVGLRMTTLGDLPSSLLQACQVLPAQPDEAATEWSPRLR